MYRYFLWDPNSPAYQVWELKHVESIKFVVSKQSQAYGLPTKSSSATQVFDTQGPIASFQLSFTRFDYEEEISNWDFMFAKDLKKGGKRYKGIDWYTSQLQTTRPYKFAITWSENNLDTLSNPTDSQGRPVSVDLGQIPTGNWKVSVTNITFAIDSENPGKASFSINLVERR